MSMILSTPKGAFMTIVEIVCDPIDAPLFFSCVLQCFNDEAIDNYENIENMKAPNDGDATFLKNLSKSFKALNDGWTTHIWFPPSTISLLLAQITCFNDGNAHKKQLTISWKLWNFQ